MDVVRENMQVVGVEIKINGLYLMEFKPVVN